MDRRAFMKRTLAGAGTLALGGIAMNKTALGSEKLRKPNIVLFFVDDHTVETINKGGLCPNIKSLGETGVTFERAYVPHPWCAASRFAILSGHCLTHNQRKDYKSDIGPGRGDQISVEGQIWSFGGKITRDEWCMPKLVKLGGYTTFCCGKLKMAGTGGTKKEKDPWKRQQLYREAVRAFGWDDSGAVIPGNLKMHKTEKGYMSTHNPEWRAQVTMDFIDKNKDKPFLCYIASNLMHAPPPYEQLKNADPRHACDDIILDKAPDVMPPRKSVIERVRKAGLEENERDFAPLLWLDDMVGAVLGKLDKLGLRDNTMVALIQDNGHHGGKQSAYTGGHDVSPAFISWPAATKNPGRVYKYPVSSLDLIPTFMAAAGVKKPKDAVLEGTSLLPVIKGQNKPVHTNTYGEAGHTRWVITRNWHYIAFRVPISKQLTPKEKQERRKVIAEAIKKGDTEKAELLKSLGDRVTQVAKGVTDTTTGLKTHTRHFLDRDQLYDLDNDPDEQNNLAYDPKYKEVLHDMKKLMREECLRRPGTFAEFKTIEECPQRWQKMVAEAKKKADAEGIKYGYPEIKDYYAPWKK